MSGRWTSPGTFFSRAQRRLGAALVVIGISRVVAAAIKDHPGGHTVLELVFSAVIPVVIPVVILIYMLKFSKSYPERVSHTQSQNQSAT